MSDDNERLNEVLATGLIPDPRGKSPNYIGDAAASSPQQPTSSQRTDLDLCQWQVGPNGTFRPAAKTVESVPAGAYSCQTNDLGPFLVTQPLMSDEIVKLPESANIRVLDGIRKFWKSRKRYSDHGLVFKRGILLWGPPGSGKTISVHLLTRDLIDKGGIVVFCGSPDVTAWLIAAIRRIEQKRPLIVVYEDVDEIISKYGEHTILSLLDGEQQTDNLVSVATTNYPERLGARIVNRPSRFDDRIFVGMPSEAARLTYLRKATSNGSQMSDDLVQKWARETNGFSIAHLRELVAAVLCLDQDYDDVVSRLKSMNERPKDIDGFAKRNLGFGQIGAAVA